MRCRPRSSKRVITSPIRRRCTPSGLTRTSVRSMLTARKSDTRASDRDRLLEPCLAAEGPDHGGTEAGGEQPRGEFADLGGVDCLQPCRQLVGFDDLSLEQ